MDSLAKKRIERFISIVEKIKNSRFVKETETVSFHLNITIGQPLKQEVTGFDEEDLRSMLMDLRKFTLTRDDVRIPDICDLLMANTLDQQIISNLQTCKDEYEKLMEEPVIKMIINTKTETGKDVIKKWLYGNYVHEAQHEKDLADLGIGKQLHKANFVFAVTGLIKLSAYIANNAKLII